MTTTTYNQIATALDNLLANVPNVKGHFAYEPQQMTVYPATTILPIGHRDEFKTLRDTKREYTFNIRIWGKLEETRTDTQTAVRDLADAVINTITSQANMSLGGLVEWSNLTEGKFVFVQKGGSFYVCELTYKAIVTFNRG